jgi:hypothetical protein
MLSKKKREFSLRERIVNPRAISFLAVLTIAVIACTASAAANSVTDGKVTYGDNTTIWEFKIVHEEGDQIISHTTVAWCGDGTNIASVKVSNKDVKWDFSYFPKNDIYGIRVFPNVKKEGSITVTVTLNGIYPTYDKVIAAIFSGSNTYGPYTIEGPIFVSSSNCSDIDAIAADYNLTIQEYYACIYDWNLTCVPSNQYIHINDTDNSKSVDIRVLGNVFTCTEVGDLVNGLDLENFTKLPEVIEIEYNDDGSVDLRVWLDGSTASTSEPDLTVKNLQLVTGAGSFDRLDDLNIACDCTADEDGECEDERIIVGVSIVTKMIQLWEGEPVPLNFDAITVSTKDDPACTIVEFGNGADVNLTVDVTELVQCDFCMKDVYVVNLAILDFGVPTVWAEGPPKYIYVVYSVNYTAERVNRYYYPTFDVSEGYDMVEEMPPTYPYGGGFTLRRSDPRFERIEFLELENGDWRAEYYLYNNSTDYCFYVNLSGGLFYGYDSVLAMVGSHYTWPNGSCPLFDHVESRAETVNGNYTVTVEVWNGSDLWLTMVSDYTPITSSVFPPGYTTFRSIGKVCKIMSYYGEEYTLVDYYECDNGTPANYSSLTQNVSNALFKPPWNMDLDRITALVVVLTDYDNFDEIIDAGICYVTEEPDPDNSESILITLYSNCTDSSRIEIATKSFDDCDCAGDSCLESFDKFFTFQIITIKFSDLHNLISYTFNYSIDPKFQKSLDKKVTNAQTTFEMEEALDIANCGTWTKLIALENEIYAASDPQNPNKKIQDTTTRDALLAKIEEIIALLDITGC